VHDNPGVGNRGYQWLQPLVPVSYRGYRSYPREVNDNEQAN